MSSTGAPRSNTQSMATCASPAAVTTVAVAVRSGGGVVTGMAGKVAQAMAAEESALDR